MSSKKRKKFKLKNKFFVPTKKNKLKTNKYGRRGKPGKL